MHREGACWSTPTGSPPRGASVVRRTAQSPAGGPLCPLGGELGWPVRPGVVPESGATLIPSPFDPVLIGAAFTQPSARRPWAWVGSVAGGSGARRAKARAPRSEGRARSGGPDGPAPRAGRMRRGRRGSAPIGGAPRGWRPGARSSATSPSAPTPARGEAADRRPPSRRRASAPAGSCSRSCATAKSDGRSSARALGYALEQIADGKADGLVVSDLQRLSRSIVDLGALMAWFRDAHAALIALDLDIDTSTARGRRVASTLIALSEREHERIAHRTQQLWPRSRQRHRERPAGGQRPARAHGAHRAMRARA